MPWQPAAGASLRLVECDPEAEQRQTHIDRLLVGVLHGDFQIGPGRMAAIILSESVRATKHPTLVQV
jgi:hypothetical protein